MAARIIEAHPNFGQMADISQTMARYAASPFENTLTTKPLGDLAPVITDADLARFERPTNRNLVENMTPSITQGAAATAPHFQSTSPDANTQAQLQAAKCADAQRHWSTCTKCRRREFFMVLLEMIAYILTGIMLIFALKSKPTWSN